MKRDWKKHIGTFAFAAFLLVILFVPAAKAKLIEGLMEIGLFKPNVSEKNKPVNSDLSAIKFKDAKGNVLSLADLKGKIIFLNFWATWCPPCLAEMPSINKLYTQFKNDPNVIFIFADADGDLIKSGKFMTNRKFDMPVYKVESEIPEQIFSGALPTTVIFDKQGRISFMHEGIANYSNKKFVDFLNKLKI
ncbi:MAG: TlpA family protein disulfide reductase [Pedobacter sp.]|nr:MAG: TlpA family protein disulfide reductase [Pedobacter sp.]